MKNKKAQAISQKRLRKIEHLRKYRAENGKSKARDKAIHFMKMEPEDIQTAFDGPIY